MGKRESHNLTATPLCHENIKRKTKPIDEREKTINIQLRPYSQQITQTNKK